MTARQRRRVISVFAPGIVLRPPLDDRHDWRERALCTQTDPEAFYPDKGGSTREAKKVCRACDVRTECLQDALDRNARFGIWGGLSERERRKLKRRGEYSPPEQVCPSCSETQPLDEFRRHNGTLRDDCWICVKDRRAAPYSITVSQFAGAKARVAADESITAVARDLGVGRSYLSRLLAGKAKPAPDTVPDAAAATNLGVSQPALSACLAGSRHPAAPDPVSELKEAS